MPTLHYHPISNVRNSLLSHSQSLFRPMCPNMSSLRPCLSSLYPLSNTTVSCRHGRLSFLGLGNNIVRTASVHSRTAQRFKSRHLGIVSVLPPSEVSPEEATEHSMSDSGGREINKGFGDRQGAHLLERESSPISWDSIPQRFKLVMTASFAFVICNMDKVNLSVAIIPMSRQLGWNASTAGLVQSSFFWGYALSQLPGGWLAKRFTGKTVLGAGVLLWSLATAMVPFAASSMPGLLLCRVMVGLGEGISPAAATDLIARSMPATERSRAVAFVFSGLSVGSVVGLLLAPPCIETFGWESVFYIFGILGVLWCIAFKLASDEAQPGKITVQREVDCSESTESTLTQKKLLVTLNDEATRGAKIPWKSFLRSSAVWSMVYAHFCGNWGHYNYLSWLPTYFGEELHLDLTNAALVSIFPPLASVLVSSIAAPWADHLISTGVDTTVVRKLCQTIGFMSPAVCMTIASLDTGLSSWVTVWILTAGLALSSFALAGLYCTHQDISPKYASILLGITNTAGAFPGIFGVYLTGYLLDQTHSWSLALFAPSIFFYVTGTIVWNVFASSEPQNFDL